jgi:hypothetical protein
LVVQLGLQAVLQLVQVRMVEDPRQRLAVLVVQLREQGQHGRAHGGGVLTAGCCCAQWHPLRRH